MGLPLVDFKGKRGEAPASKDTWYKYYLLTYRTTYLKAAHSKHRGEE